ncbi:WD repeat and HMG-box DNA-binding protein 1 isoform X1 [Coccinella septempunctata]|uniref:WD repeat and HMG-box DNA-binding protein 1 isoform X1 n=1 Tax=Coccinella septempunctata TaxID=41139 RepID=UPI001D06FAC8|nr:WD repeat and HMG-box DNA-binding protein 1 isoform X1 [Coccinella septempunctata]
MPISHVPFRYAHNEGHTDICFSEDGQKYVTCGSDGDIRIWSQDLYEDPVHNCVGEWALAVRQKGSKLYIATSNNDVQIITFPDGDREGVLDRFVAPINNIAISKSGELIALAAEQMEVKLIQFEGEQKKISSIEGTAPYLSVAICPTAKLIAASSGDGKLRIWNVSDKNLVKEINCFPKVNSFSNATVLCRIDFNPTNGCQLSYPDGSSVVVLNTSDWSEVCTLSCDDVTKPFSIVQYSPCGKYLAASSVDGDFVIWDVAEEIVHNVSKHPNGTRVSAFAWNPSGLNQIVYTDVEGQLGVMSDCISEKQSAEKSGAEEAENNDVDFGDYQFEDDDEDNENAVSLEKLKKQYADDDEPELRSVASRSPTPRPRTPEIPLQPAFMPSSTPTHLDPRYLCWNEVGIVRGYGSILDEDESTSKSIEVDFHDSTFHSSMMMQNFQNYMMGSLSTSALVVANSTQINVIPLASRTKEWTLTMDDNEEIVAVAASEQLVCIALANYIIRVCSPFGTQRAVFSVPGPIVCVSAFREDILVAYHSGPVRNGDQNICFKHIRLDAMSFQGQDLGGTLGPQSTLLWMGFSDSGTPGVLDSCGLLHMHPLHCNTWIPFCNVNKHKKGLSDAFFVTAILESNQTLCGIKCRGTMYPAVTPRPTMCEVPLEAPFAEMTTEKGQMESSMFTWSALEIPNTEKKLKETALKTFALACKTNLDQRAQEVMEILANPGIINLAIKYASKLDKKRLVERLTDLVARLADQESETATVNDNEVPETIKPVKRLTLNMKNTSRNQITNGSEEVVSKNQETHNSLLSDSMSSSINDSMNSSIVLNSQESMVLAEAPRNPFLKSLKKTKPVDQNPLSLLDSKAGVSFSTEKLNGRKEEAAEKRKQPESETENQKAKQRKLDRFMFGKRQ